MVPQAGAVTPVGQVTVHVAVWSLDPETKALNGWVVLVITLAVVGEIAMVMVVAAVPPPPQPRAPNPSARVKIKQNFHGLMPVLPQNSSIDRAADASVCVHHNSQVHKFKRRTDPSPCYSKPQSERPAHCEPERAYRIEKIGPLWVVCRIDEPNSIVRSPQNNL